VNPLKPLVDGNNKRFAAFMMKVEENSEIEFSDASLVSSIRRQANGGTEAANEEGSKNVILLLVLQREMSISCSGLPRSPRRGQE
jgi:hypothetical protein